MPTISPAYAQRLRALEKRSSFRLKAQKFSEYADVDEMLDLVATLRSMLDEIETGLLKEKRIEHSERGE